MWGPHCVVEGEAVYEDDWWSGATGRVKHVEVAKPCLHRGAGCTLPVKSHLSGSDGSPWGLMRKATGQRHSHSSRIGCHTCLPLGRIFGMRKERPAHGGRKNSVFFGLTLRAAKHYTATVLLPNWGGSWTLPSKGIVGKIRQFLGSSGISSCIFSYRSKIVKAAGA